MAFSGQYCISEVRKLAENFQRYQLVSGVTHRWKMCGAILTNRPVSSFSLINVGGLICLEGLVLIGSVKDWTVKVHAWLP